MQEEENKEGLKDLEQSPLKSLDNDLRFYEESIREIAKDILKNGISRFPIFVAHQHESSIGEPILDKDELGTDWSIQASTIEEFLEKNIVLKAKREYFELNFKDPLKYMCLFVIVPEGANFVFYPYH